MKYHKQKTKTQSYKYLIEFLSNMTKDVNAIETKKVKIRPAKDVLELINNSNGYLLWAFHLNVKNEKTYNDVIIVR